MKSDGKEAFQRFCFGFWLDQTLSFVGQNPQMQCTYTEIPISLHGSAKLIIILSFCIHLLKGYMEHNSSHLNIEY